MLLHSTGGLLRPLLLGMTVDLGIAVFLVTVQLLHKLLNIWDAVGTGVVLSHRDNSLLGVHVERVEGESAQDEVDEVDEEKWKKSL